jgi:hypothetical protein
MTATARTATKPKTPRESKRGVPRRFRKDYERAKKNEEQQHTEELQGLVLHLPPRPTPEPRPERVPLRERDKLPIARPVMKNPKGELNATGAVVVNRVGHHACRADLHALRYLRSAKQGASRLGYGLYNYVQMPDSLRAIAALTDGPDANSEQVKRLSKIYVKQKKAAWRHVRATLSVAGPVVLVALVALALFMHQLLTGIGGEAWWTIPAPVVTLLSWVHLDRLLGWAAAIPLVALVASAGLSFYGRHRFKTPGPVMQLADTRPVPKIEGRPSADTVYLAFKNSGIEGVVCDPPHREGPGWETVARIPVGKQTFIDAAAAHAAIAGNLGRGLGSECLFLSPVRGPNGSEKHVRVWWADSDPFVGDPPDHPLLDPRNQPADLWNSCLPIGLDERGTVARIAVVDTPFVGVIGLPGSGKTHLFFGMSVGTAADPLWDQDCWSFKASDDYAPIKPLVKACGGTYDYGTDEATYDRFYRYLVRMQKEVVERNKRFGSLPFHQNPNGKVERDVAADPRNGLRPRLVLIDEIITAIDGDKRILPALEELARTVRSLNWVFVFGAQFADSDTFKNLQKLFGATICFSVKRWQDSKGALGSDHVPNVADASTIPSSAKGVAILAGAIEDPKIGPRPAFKFRSFNINRQLLADHVARMLATVRAGQGARISLVKDDDPFVANLTKALANGPVGVTALANQLGYGEGLGAVRKFTTDARKKAGIEPLTETRDSGGVVARGVKYIDPAQLTGH